MKTLNFSGPALGESAKTFSDYRLDVEFVNKTTGQRVLVPGYFAADGNAENSSATSGNVWRAHFNPPEAGSWTWTASFRTGSNIAASIDAKPGVSAGFMDGAKGSVWVAASEVGAPLTHDGDRYPSMGGTTFLKSGANSPENFLAYADFDDTDPTHAYAAHLKDWRPGDPTWDGGRGKAAVGALNYLASEGVNALYMIPITAGGDGRDVWPWASSKFGDLPKSTGAVLPAASNKADLQDALVYDVSKLAQWGVLFEHAANLGIVLHFQLMERENDRLLNNGGLGVERAIYYREMVARFGHHDGVIWNLGEETTRSTAQLKASAARLKALDPYDHLVAVHTYPGEYEAVYGPLLGDRNIDAFSLQNSSADHLKLAESWLARAEAAGRPWALFWDEQFPARDGVLPDGVSGAAANHAAMRASLWGMLFTGAAGSEWYFGYDHKHNDLTLEDFRSRDSVWDWTRHAREFLEAELPFEDMDPAKGLAPSAVRVFAKPGEVYALYLPDGGAQTLDLSGQAGTFSVQWYDPRNGGDLATGTVSTVTAGKIVSIGLPPAARASDWVAVVRKAGVQAEPDGGAASFTAVVMKTVDDAEQGQSLYSDDLEVGRHIVGLRLTVPEGVDLGAGDVVASARLSFTAERSHAANTLMTFSVAADVDGPGFGSVTSRLYLPQTASWQTSGTWTKGERITAGVDLAPQINALLASGGVRTGDVITIKIEGSGGVRFLEAVGPGHAGAALAVDVASSAKAGATKAAATASEAAGAGAETFMFRDASDSTRVATDKIVDFDPGDRIDLTALGLNGIARTLADYVDDTLLVRALWSDGVRLNAGGWDDDDFQLDVRGDVAAILDGILL